MPRARVTRLHACQDLVEQGLEVVLDPAGCSEKRGQVVPRHGGRREVGVRQSGGLRAAGDVPGGGHSRWAGAPGRGRGAGCCWRGVVRPGQVAADRTAAGGQQLGPARGAGGGPLRLGLSAAGRLQSERPLLCVLSCASRASPFDLERPPGCLQDPGDPSGPPTQGAPCCYDSVRPPSLPEMGGVAHTQQALSTSCCVGP